MEFTVEKQTIHTKQETKTEVLEHPLDSEAVLPDYCPDIARILKCRANPVITAKRLADGGGVLEGTVLTEVLYADAKGELITFAQSVPLYHEISAPDGVDFCAVAVKMQYCNCRATEARKVEIHGAVGIKVNYYSNRENRLVIGAQGKGVELLSCNQAVATLVAHTEKSVTVGDEIPVASGSVRRILHTRAEAHNIEYKVVSGRCVVKGEIVLQALYQNTECRYETLRGQIPFSQIVEAEGLEEGDTCQITVLVLTTELRPRTGLDGECKNVAVTSDVLITLSGYRSLELPLVTDGYSTQCGIGIRRCNGEIITSVQQYNENYTAKGQLDVGRELSVVLECCCSPDVSRVQLDEQRLTIHGTLQCELLGLDIEGQPIFVDKSLDFIWEKEVPDELSNCNFESQVTVQKESFTLIGGSELELRVQLDVQIAAFCSLMIEPVTDLVLDPSVSPEVVGVPLVLYYAKAGERLFDIARRYNTTARAVCEANELTEQTLSRQKALIIPIS